ncbi:FtsQ-type POTRA domain-containing protein [Cobetia sp. cqz5-12]|uniref:cell division protein FtsQ/DivIB n=1 Tax=unclassified Cobetia TaxID=2609414 RepID=UPI001408A92F|nr:MULTISPECIES: cell division protein FtsQ/DivIB [unclassified Cobetia]NHH86226.1 Cell division protein FtsQ [Cobetia sp. MB87]QQK63308.1 FtsQ-type POTRA domain-containing protein [Cobetia sp. cqz5-12]
MAARSTTGAIFGLVLGLALLVAGGQALWTWLDRPIERVTIKGDFDHVSAAYLQRHIAPLIRGQSWLSVPLGEVRRRALAIDWLSEVSISRRWPDTLEFELFEQQPVAYWNDGELLNVRGDAFQAGPVTQLGNLPNLAGPEGSGSEVLAELDALQSQLGGLGLNVSQLRLEPRGAWRFQVNDSVWVMLGRNDREARLARFMAAWQRRLGDEASQIRYIDLRYPNGVAVAWHGETTALEEGKDS